MSDTPDYKILRAEVHSAEDRKTAIESAMAKLERLVRASLAEGWEPAGGICAEHIVPLHVYAYSQAMLRRPA